MNLRQVIPTDVTASAIVHLTLLALLFLFSEVHQLGSVPAETIPVDIVTPQEMVENKPDPAPTPTPQPDFALPDKPAATAEAPAATPQQSAPPPQKQAAPPAPAARPCRRRRPTRRPSLTCRSNIM
jgi:hypothetical protein